MGIAVNGFGRVGRAFARIAPERGLEVVAVNDVTDAATLAHLLAQNSTYGRAPFTVEHTEDALIAGGELVKVFGWYDNEWGYTERLADLAEYVGATL